MEQGAGMGIAVQQMIAEKSKGEKKGGVISIADPVKFEGTSPVEQIFGAGLQGAGQGFGGAMGLMASNISGMVGLDGFTGVNIIGDLKSDISEKMQSLQNEGYLKLKGEGGSMLQSGVSAFHGESPAISVSPGPTPMMSAGQGHAMGG